jgi:hypothetical protein
MKSPTFTEMSAFVTMNGERLRKRRGGRRNSKGTRTSRGDDASSDGRALFP